MSGLSKTVLKGVSNGIIIEAIRAEAEAEDDDSDVDSESEYASSDVDADDESERDDQQEEIWQTIPSELIPDHASPGETRKVVQNEALTPSKRYKRSPRAGQCF